MFLERQRRYWKQAKDDALAAYGSKCVCCGESERDFLTIDHALNNGNEHRKSIKTSIYHWLKKNGYPVHGFQVLCFNCNLSKAFYGLCPHRRKAEQAGLLAES